MLYLIVIVLLAIPFIVNYEVEQWKEPVMNVEGKGEGESLLPVKAGISLLLILMTAKIFQLSNGVVLRRPILKQNP